MRRSRSAGASRHEADYRCRAIDLLDTDTVKAAIADLPRLMLAERDRDELQRTLSALSGATGGDKSAAMEVLATVGGVDGLE